METIVKFVKGLWFVVIDWIKANGVTGVVFGIAALYYLAKGNELFAGIGFGVFGTRNWDYILSKLRLGVAWIKGLWGKKE